MFCKEERERSWIAEDAMQVSVTETVRMKNFTAMCLYIYWMGKQK